MINGRRRYWLEAPMTVNRRQIASLVTMMQNEFLDTPGLALTLATARQRFGIGMQVCRAVLALLVDARVLTKTRDGAYVRRFPYLTQHAA
jgi:hypothetical protein